MIRLNRITTDHPQYPFVENLLHQSFPPEERREDAAQRANTDHHPQFSCYLITDDDTPIGVITVWSLDGFHYLEHLATAPCVRNKGYGQQIIGEIKRRVQGTLVLEAEPPTEEMSRRRIAFYERNGFTLCHRPYLQPPYRQADKAFPLLLMSSGTDGIDDRFEQIRDEIHRTVYGTSPLIG